MVLQWACPNFLVKDLDFWDIEAKVEQGQFLQSERPALPTVWHLHGRIGNADQLILTPDGYQRLYEHGAKGRYEAALKTLQALLVSRPLLFIGFSFEDDALGVQLRAMDELFAGAPGPHYALVHTQDLDRLSALDLPVVPIPFVDFGEPLLDLLRELGEISKGKSASLALPRFLSSDSSLPGASYSTDNRPFFVPFRAKGDRVIGAEQALQRVRDQLVKGKPTSIGQTASFQGLGGLGKTQLAVEYAWRFSAEYPNGVIWLTADQDIPAQLTRLAVEAKWVASESEHKVKLDIAQHRIRSYSDCLIIFDNVEDLATIEPYLPLPSAQPHLLATSRTEQRGFIPVPLNILDEEQSLALLASEADRFPVGEKEMHAAREIARELGGLPLALEMAGAYLLYRPVQWQDYWELLRNNPKAALPPQRLASFTGHEADLFATLRIQEEVFADEPLLKEILDALTWSGSAAMGSSLLGAVLSVEETNLLGALSLGVKLRLLERSAEAHRYSLHRLVRKVRQEDHPLTEDPNWVEEVCRRLGDWFFARRQDFADLATFEAEIDHLQKWREQARQLGSPQASRLTWLLAYPPFHRGQYAESQQWLDQALALFEAEGKSDPELEAWLWSDLGTIASCRRRQKDELEFHERALAVRRKSLGEEHPDIALSLSGIGAYYYDIGDSEKALDLFSRALIIRRKALGGEHPETAASLDYIGDVYQSRGDLDKGLDFYAQALIIRRKAFSDEHPETATSFTKIGGIYFNRGNFDEALDFASQALIIRRKVLGSEHPETAKSLHNIGIVHRKKGDLDEALDFFTQALAIQLKVLGEDHPDTAKSLHEIGKAYFNNGDLKQALAFGEQSLKVRREVLGTFNIGTIASATNVADTLKALGRRQEAFDIIVPYIQDPPSDPQQAGKIKSLVQQLKATPLRPGFRQPPASSKKKPKKKHR
jgi:tetratricopeptide (TPR) repeat protein